MIAFFLQLKEEKEIGTNYKLPKQTVLLVRLWRWRSCSMGNKIEKKQPEKKERTN